MGEQMQKMIRVRGQIKAQLTRFRTYLNTPHEQTDPSVEYLQTRLDQATKLWDKFEDIQSEIEQVEESDDQTRERLAFENTYFDTIALAKQMLTNRIRTADAGGAHQSNNTTAASSDLQALTNVKLPMINLPVFDGHHENWMQFHDMFNSLIHTNRAPTPVQRFHYLKSSLKNEAAKVISSLQVTDANYDVAWQLLKERFENKRSIINNHVKALFELTTIAKESYSALRQLVDNTLTHLRALKSLGQPIDQWDTLIIHLISTKLDYNTRKEWEFSIKDSSNVTLDELTKFLNSRAHILENITPNQSGSKSMQIKHTSGQPDKSYSSKNTEHTKSYFVQQQAKCPFCQNPHGIFQCKEFLKLSGNQRLNEAKKIKLCLNCLRPNHFVLECISNSNCRVCNKRHNTLLHCDQITASDKSTIVESNGGTASSNTTVVSHCAQQENQILLSTASVFLINSYRKAHECRVLLDSGSQSNFITQELCKKLKLQCEKIHMPVSGINQMSTKISMKTHVTVKSKFNSFSVNLSCLVLPQITENLPNMYLNPNQINIPSNITLADSEFNVPKKIDLLLGASVFWDLLCVGQIKLAKDQPTFQKTQLGWIISGPIPLDNNYSSKRGTICNFTLEQQIERFWKMETIETHRKWSTEELKCEQHFTDTVAHATNGHYIVSIPFHNEKLHNLGDSEHEAVKRLKAVERRFEREPRLKVEYSRFMQEYENMGHMKEVSAITNKTETGKCYYMPHHAVLKETSETTKLRVVFDASCKTDTGISLNDCMLVGPTIQNDLLSIVLLFRTHQYVITGDIEKMYRMIYIHEDQRDLQRIVWRYEPEEEIKHYQLLTVTYGTAAAPFLAIRSIHEIAKEIQKSNPRISEIIRDDFYVDDLITGARSLEEAVQTARDLSNMIETRGLTLRKWASNDKRIIQRLSETKTQNSTMLFADTTNRGTLGLLWNSEDDTFQYQIKTRSYPSKVTKRTILSTISQIFDPLGLIGPVIIKAKIFMQELWELKVEWDEAIPMRLHTKWITLLQQLPQLETLRIPRCIIVTNSCDIQFHGFSDASTSAFRACVYVISVDTSGNVRVQLVCAKSKVAPILEVTLARLELCAALLLAQLMKKFKESSKIDPSKIVYWCDSTVALAWIAGMPNRWKTFVSNRVTEIQQLTSDGKWYHVNSNDNPADIISRGTTVLNLISNQLWWQGPEWLQGDNWPIQNISIETTDESKPIVALTVITERISILNQFSRYTKLQRVIAYCLRFIQRVRREEYQTGELTVQELEAATRKIIHMLQGECFTQEIHDLRTKGELNSKSHLLNLNPYLDEHGLIRVGGRLEHADCEFDQKHPYILPSKHHVTELIIHNEHIKLHHCGNEQLLAHIRLKFWPLAARNTIKKIAQNCRKCFNYRPRRLEHSMSDLPSTRVTAVLRPFITTGIDYAGPIQIKESRRRGKPVTTKAYICVFVCFSTKAIHLELVGNLTSESFIAAFRRFTARRGICKQLYSDNGTNFVGANTRLRELYNFIKENEDNIKTNLAQRNIEWKFIPPRAPHLGGLWEAAVKAVKTHLFKVIQNLTLTYEECYTLLNEIEAILNSRPLSALSNSPDDLTPLTPSHFLIGDAILDPPEACHLQTPDNRLTHWERIQKVKQHFWRRWHKEYLHQLQVRTKWHTKTPNVQSGTLVLIMEDNIPPLKWITGRIIEVYPGEDGVIRVVKVKTVNGEVKRPVRKLCALPNQ